MNKFKPGDKVRAKVEDGYTSAGKITEVLFIPGDKEYDEQYCGKFDEGFIHKPYLGKESGCFKKKTLLNNFKCTWNLQEDFDLVKD